MPLPSKQNAQSQIEQGQQVSEHSESSEWINVKHSGRKNLCEICDNVFAKYTCPKCDMKTCSLACIKKHKEVKQCSGERESIQYVSRDQIDQKVVSKDYNFIEEMISSADKVKKVLSGVNNTINLEPRRFKILRTHAKQLYNIRLSNGPNILERHRDNISFFFVKNKSIYWVFELLYFQGSSQGMIKTSKTLTQPTSDQKTFLESLPEDYLDKQLLETKGINTTKRNEFEVFLQNKQKQNEWSSENEDAEKSSGKKIVFSSKIVSGKFTTLYELIWYEMEMKIQEQMRNISVFQFPTLFVVHKSLKDEFLSSYKSSKACKAEGEKHEKEKGHEERGSERERSRNRSYLRKAKVHEEQ